MGTLSSYMAAAKDRGLPPEVVEKAKHHILDTFAAMISGTESSLNQTKQTTRTVRRSRILAPRSYRQPLRSARSCARAANTFCAP